MPLRLIGSSTWMFAGPVSCFKKQKRRPLRDRRVFAYLYDLCAFRNSRAPAQHSAQNQS